MSRSGLGDYMVVPMIAVMGVVSWFVGSWARSVTGIPLVDDGMSLVVFVLIVYVGMGFTVFKYLSIDGDKWQGLLWVSFATVALVVMSNIFATSVIKITANGQCSNAGEIIFEKIAVGDHVFFMMDGRIDAWVYALYKEGVFSIPYESMGVMEKGVAYFYWLVMLLMRGYNPYYMVLANWTALVLGSFVVFLIARRAFGGRVGYLVMCVFLLYPENLYWSAMVYKDIVVVLIVLLAIYALIGAAMDTYNVYFWILLLFALGAMAFIRSGLFLVLVLMGVFSMALLSVSRFKAVARYALIVVCATTAFNVLAPKAIVADLEQKIFLKTYVKGVDGSSRYLDSQNITYRSSKNESIVELYGGGDMKISNAYFLPLRIAFYLMAPFPPLMRRNDGDYYILPSTWLIVIMWSFFFYGSYRCVVSRNYIALVVLVSFIVLSAAVVYAGPFVYERYRLVFMPMYFSIAIFGVATMSWRQRGIMASLSGILFVFILSLWLVLKGNFPALWS